MQKTKRPGDVSRALYGLRPYDFEELLPDRPKKVTHVDRSGRVVVADEKRRRYVLEDAQK